MLIVQICKGKRIHSIYISISLPVFLDYGFSLSGLLSIIFLLASFYGLPLIRFALQLNYVIVYYKTVCNVHK